MKVNLSPQFRFVVYPRALILGSLLVLSFLAPHVALAYSLQMAAPPPFAESAVGSIPGSFMSGNIGFIPPGTSSVNPTAGPRAFSGPHTQVFVSRLLRQVKADPKHLLWSMYPASVRGRTFGAEGGNPLLSGLSSSGGW